MDEMKPITNKFPVLYIFYLDDNNSGSVPDISDKISLITSIGNNVDLFKSTYEWIDSSIETLSNLLTDKGVDEQLSISRDISNLINEVRPLMNKFFLEYNGNLATANSLNFVSRFADKINAVYDLINLKVNDLSFNISKSIDSEICGIDFIKSNDLFNEAYDMIVDSKNIFDVSSKGLNERELTIFKAVYNKIKDSSFKNSFVLCNMDDPDYSFLKNVFREYDTIFKGDLTVSKLKNCIKKSFCLISTDKLVINNQFELLDSYAKLMAYRMTSNFTLSEMIK